MLSNFAGRNLANVAATAARHFGVPSSYPSLVPDLLPPALLHDVARIATLVIDALGYDALHDAIAAGYVPNLAALRQAKAATFGSATSVFPSTTVAALTTLATGLAPCEHGNIAEKLFDAQLQTAMSVLSFSTVPDGRPLDAAGIDPTLWLGYPTQYIELAAQGVPSTVLSHVDYQGTAFSRINHRGADYIGCYTLSDLCAALRTTLETASGRGYIYAYWGMLDMVANRYGVGSAPYMAELQLIDHAIGQLVLRKLSVPRTLLVILADQGQINTPPERWIWLNDYPQLLALLRRPPTSDHRSVVLHVQDGCRAAASAFVGEQLGHCAEVVPAEWALEQELYGPRRPIPRIRQRMGDLLLVARENWVLRYDCGNKARQVWQIGTHGGLSRHEMLVPLIR